MRVRVNLSLPLIALLFVVQFLFAPAESQAGPIHANRLSPADAPWSGTAPGKTCVAKASLQTLGENSSEFLDDPGSDGIGVCSGCVCVVCRQDRHGNIIFCIEYDLCM